MKKTPAALAILGVGLVSIVAAQSLATGAVDTVGQVAAGLAHHPRAWVGRTVTVRGTLLMLTYDILDAYGRQTGYGAGTCGGIPQCSMTVPTGARVHLYLVGQVPQDGAAYAHLVLSAPTAPPGWPSGLVMPHLIVLVSPNRVQPTLGHLAPAVQHAIDLLPDGVVRALVQVPLLLRLTEEVQPMVQGDTPRLYRVRLLPRVAQLVTCTPLCDDAVLLDNLH